MSAIPDVAIRGGTVVGAHGRAPLDVYISEGRVVELTPHGQDRSARETIDASGLLVLPGMVETHVHFMDPGDPDREDFPTGTKAAALAGVTTVVEHTHGWPVTDAERLDKKRLHLRDRSYVDFGLAAHVWPDKLEELPAMWHDGVTYFKAFTCETHGVPAIGADAMLELADVLARLDAPCLVHCEDDAITAANERRLRAALRADGGIVPEWRSREAELVAVQMVALIARLRAARLVVAHASSADVLELLEQERALGSQVVAESCPQYLNLREQEVIEQGAFRKFTPPARIRSDSDRDRMWSAFNTGLIHHISSDHAPATRAQKTDGSVWDVHFGLPGVDTTMPMMLSAALAGATSLERLVEAYATAPARLYGIARKGRLSPGFDADVALVDPAAEWEISDERVVSKAGWTPYAGTRVRGRVVATLLRGKVIARDGELEQERPTGLFLRGAGSR